MDIINGFVESIQGIIRDSGFIGNDWRNYIMIVIAGILIFLAIKKQYEPLLLLPIAFGMLIVNLFPAIMAPPETQMQLVSDYMAAHDGVEMCIRDRTGTVQPSTCPGSTIK